MNSLTPNRRSAGQPGREKLLALFREFEGQWIELPAILRLGVAQYNARIKQLRGEGYVIENRVEWRGRVKHSWFRFQGKPSH